MRKIIIFTAALSIIVSIPSIAADNGMQREPLPGKRAASYAFDNRPRPAYAEGRIGPGVFLATTAYDVQQMCSMGRQIEHRGTNYLHMAWTAQATMVFPGDRNIEYQAYDLTDCSFVFPNPIRLSPEFSGYISLDADQNGCAIVSGDEFYGLSDWAPASYWDFCTGEPIGFFTYDFPSDVYGWYYTGGMGPLNENLWPKIDWQIGSEQVLHMVATESLDGVDHWQPDVKTISYYRRVGPYGAGTGIWSNQLVIDTVTNNNVTIAASPVSDNVAVVWGAPMEYKRNTPYEYSHLYENDIWYMISNDQGNTWQAPVNITNYPQYSNWRAACDISALYSSDDYLHIVWDCRRWDGPAIVMYLRQAAIFHWSEDNPVVRTVYKAFWDDNSGTCRGHEWGGDVGKMSLSECDDKFYVLFSQFGDYGVMCADVAGNQLENGELYLTASSDGGYIWDNPNNLTNTISPSCAPGNCESDYWASMARYGRQDIWGCEGITPNDYVLDIFYINDRYPGSAVSSDDGAFWTINNAMWLPIPCRDVRPVVETSDACCLPDGSCINTTNQTECENTYGGVWYPNTSCVPNPCLVDIYGAKFFDENRNSIRDGSDAGMSGWEIVLSSGNNEVATDITDQNGEYSFTGLLPSVYKITERMPAGKLWIQTYPAPLMHIHTTAPGDILTDIDFGNWSPDTLDQKNCIRPADGLFSWWPFDEVGQQVAYDIAGRRDGTHFGLVPDGAGKVRGAYQMMSGNAGFVRVYDDPFSHIRSGDFTIDAWVKLEDCTGDPKCNTRIIMDNHRCGIGDGVMFFMRYDPGAMTWKLGLKMNHVPPFFSDPVSLPLGSWIHVAVTASRQTDPTNGRFYLDGLPLGGPFQPIQGDVYSKPHCCLFPMLDIGHAPPDQGCDPPVTSHYYIDGWLDEVEIFSRALTDNDIWDLYWEDYMGKCHEYCHVPPSTMFCLDDYSRTVTLTICNESNLNANYKWWIYGFWGSSPCNFQAVGSFTPNSGTEFIPAWQCRYVDIDIDRPQAGPITFGPGDIACYHVVVQNTMTGGYFTCEGNVFGSDKACIRGPDFRSAAVTDLYAGDTVSIDYVIVNTGDSVDGTIDYEIAAVSSCACDSAAEPIVSLDGQPPGTIITGSTYVPYLDSVTVSVNVELTEYQAHNFQNIVFRDDFDEDDMIDPYGASFAIHPVTFPDCNGNGIDDSIDIATGFSPDTNGNAYPDDCEFNDEPCYYAGDANNDNQANVADAVFLINYVFKEGPAPPCSAKGDANGDCGVDVADAVYLINFVFKEGAPPIINYECTW